MTTPTTYPYASIAVVAYRDEVTGVAAASPKGGCSGRGSHCTCHYILQGEMHAVAAPKLDVGGRMGGCSCYRQRCRGMRWQQQLLHPSEGMDAAAGAEKTCRKALATSEAPATWDPLAPCAMVRRLPGAIALGRHRPPPPRLWLEVSATKASRKVRFGFHRTRAEGRPGYPPWCWKRKMQRQTTYAPCCCSLFPKFIPGIN